MIRKRNYAKETAWENEPEQVAERVARNKARRHMIKMGLAKKGDGKDVDHKDSNPLNNKRSNWRMLTSSKNKSMNTHDGKEKKQTTRKKKKTPKRS